MKKICPFCSEVELKETTLPAISHRNSMMTRFRFGFKFVCPECGFLVEFYPDPKTIIKAIDAQPGIDT